MIKEIKMIEPYKYLGQLWVRLPNKCILNKGVTGCGGTTVELKSNRNSIILVPTVELVRNKTDLKNGIFGLSGDIKNTNIIKSYINSDFKYKKIICTYDSLPKLIGIIGEKIYTDYFLLVDEYHIFFNYYSLRLEAIRNVLNAYSRFKRYCFMTATPLNDDTMLEELKHLRILNLTWETQVPVKITTIDKRYTIVTLKDEIFKCISNSTYNLHIFFNSVKTIAEVIKDLSLTEDNYRIICSKKSQKNYKLNFKTSKDSVERINFYTAACFEGVDIQDEIGKTIVISDSSIATTIHDISTLFVQICGRLRDSIYKDEVTFILNSGKHRYTTKPDFDNSAKLGHIAVQEFNEKTGDNRELALRKLKQNPNLYNTEYVVWEDPNLIYDPNLRKVDEQNYHIVERVYNQGINVIKEIESQPSLESKRFVNLQETDVKTELDNILDFKKIYTYDELSKILDNILIKKGKSFKRTDIRKYMQVIGAKKYIKGKLCQTYQIVKTL